MKIATIYTLYGRRAGAELCFETTIKAINRNYPDVEWIIFCNDEAYDTFEDAKRIKMVKVSMLNNQYKKAYWLEFMSRKFVMSYNPDCFWIPSGCNHFPGKWSVPVLTTFHDFGEYHVKNKYSKMRMVFRKRICIPLNLKRAKLFTTVSQFTANDLVALFHKDPSKISVVYNGASPHSIKLAENEDDNLKKLGLQKGQYLFTPGRTDYIGKGLDLLFEAFRKIGDKKLKLVLVGPKGEGHELMLNDLSKDNYANGRILYLGRVSDENLALLYKNCLATIISSRFEGFGFPVLEAMEYQVPVICSDAGALPEVAGESALVFKNGCSKDLLRCMERIITDNELRSSLIANSEQQYKKFNWDSTAKGMYMVFKKIIE